MRKFAGLVILFVMLAPPLPVLAQNDRNCDDFTVHADAVAWFNANGGSTTVNAGGLDGDGDGVPCERLIRVGGLRGAVETASDNWPVTVGAGLGVALVSGAGIMAFRRRRPAPTSDVPPAVASGFRIQIPELEEIAATGLVALSVRANGVPVPGARIVIAPEASPEITAKTDAHGTLTLTVPVGVHPCTVTSGGRSAVWMDTIGVLRDDVTRVDVQLEPTPV